MGVQFRQCSSKYPAGRWENCSMGWSKIFLLASLAFSASFAARQLRGNGRYGQRVRKTEVEENQEPRDERSLVNTFPFNARNDHGDHHDHHDHHEHDAEPQQFQNLEPIDARQRNRNRNRNPPPRGGGGDSQPVSFNEVSPTTSPSRRRSVRRTTGRVVSLNMKQLLSTKLYKCAVHLL